jgi:hypothetical protein
LDPAAVLAVGHAESGINPFAVGDAGTSFGVFQLHRGGALPRGRGPRWAASRQGIDYALRQMATVARGLRGREAVAAIVRGFERPAAPEAEISRAMGVYGNFPAADAAAPRFRRTGRLVLAPPPDLGQIGAQEILSQLQQGGDIDWLSLASTLREAESAPRRRIRVANTPAPRQRRSRSIAGYPFRLIGTPYQGTHRLGNWESDNAVDLAMPVGTPIYAAFDGVIGNQFGKLAEGGGRFAGIRLHLVGRNDELYYAHLSRAVVRPGQRVRKGQLLGYSGEANGVAHLHLGARRYDPRRYVKLRPRRRR